MGGPDELQRVLAHLCEAYALFEWLEPGDARYVQVNPRFEAMLGVRADDVVGRTLRATHAMPQSMLDALATCHREGSTQRIRWSSPFFGRELAITLFAQGDGLIGSLFHWVDGEERAEQARRESEELFQKAFHSAPLLMTISDVATGRYLEVNQMFCRVSGFSREDTIGRTSIELGWLAAEKRHLILEPLQRDGHVDNLALTLTTKDGHEIDCLYAGEMVVIGGERRLLSIALDVTERRRSHEEQERLRDQLVQAQKLESVGTLAGGIAHDFNNILSGLVMGLEELHANPACPSDVRADLDELSALTMRGADLTRDLLGFARQGPIEFKPTALGVVVERAARIFGRSRKDVTVSLDLPTDLPEVQGDATQLEQVLLNLLVNAGHAMPNGGRVELGARVVGSNVELRVRDTGMGMSAEVQERIFDPFFTTKEPGRGTGLGLASVWSIVKKHGGFVAVQSELGVGTTMRVTLPCSTGARPVAEPSPEVTPKGGQDVLVVDDEEPVRRVSKRLLERLGYRVRTASSGDEALRALDEPGFAPALVILDLVMPGMSGHDTFHAMRRRYPELKILLASGYDAEGRSEQLLAAGAVGFLSKPFRREVFAGKLAQLLG